MKSFQQHNKMLIYTATLAGLYMPSIERLIKNRYLILLLRIHIVFPIGIFTIITYSALSHLFFYKDSFMKKFYDMTVVITTSLLLFKLIFYNKKRQEFERIFDMWESLFKNNFLLLDKKRVLLQEKTKRVYKIIKFLLAMGLAGTVLYGIPPYFRSDKTIAHPIGIEYRKQSPDYELYLTLELFGALYANVIGIAFDSIMLLLLTLQEVELIHLRNCIAEIIRVAQVDQKEEHRKGETVQDVAVVRQNIVVWVNHHQKAIRFHEELRRLYYTPLCVQFSNIAASVCMVCFLIAAGALSKLQILISILWIMGNNAVFYMNCKTGDIIRETNGDIFLKAFSREWYVYPKDLQQLMHIVIMRSSRPMDIIAFDIYPLGARSFFKIFKTAYSFFTFLLHLIKRSNLSFA